MGSDFCRKHGGLQPAFEGAPPAGGLPEFVDGLALRRLGFTEATVRFLFRMLPAVSSTDHRKAYLRGDDVETFIAAHVKVQRDQVG